MKFSRFIFSFRHVVSFGASHWTSTLTVIDPRTSCAAQPFQERMRSSSKHIVLIEDHSQSTSQQDRNSLEGRKLFNRGSVGLGEDLELSSPMRFETYLLTVSYSLTVSDSQKLLEDPWNVFGIGFKDYQRTLAMGAQAAREFGVLQPLGDFRIPPAFPAPDTYRGC